MTAENRQAKRITALLSRVSSETGLLWLVYFAIAGAMLFHLYTLTSYPPLFIDESWYANVAWNWLTRGENFDSIQALARQGVPWPYLGNLPWLASFAIAGLGLFQARIVAWIFGLVLVIGVFLVGRLSFGRIAGALAALFLVINPAYLQASHYARPDVMLAAFGMFGYLFMLSGFQKEARGSHLLAGLLLGLAVDIHLNALIFIFGFLILYRYQYKKGLLRSRGFWFFLLGGFLAFVYYIAVHVLPEPSAFFNFFRYSLGSEHQMPISSLNLVVLLRSLRAEIGRYHFFDNNLTFALLGASAVYLIWRRKPADQRLLVFTGAAFTGFVLLAGNKHDIYAILLYPFSLLVVAEGLVSLVRASRDLPPVRAFASALILLSLVSGMIVMARPALDGRGYDYYAVTNKIRQEVPSGAKIMGLPNWWLGLPDYDFRSVMGLTYLHFLEGLSLKEGLERLKPDYLIFDTGLNGLLVEQGYFGEEGFEVYKLPRAEFENFLRARAEMIMEFSNPWHGYFQIYAVDWNP